MPKPSPHIGRSLEGFLVERGDFERVQLLAAKKIAKRFKYNVMVLNDNYVGRCHEIPQLAWCAGTPDEALAGIKLAAEAVQAAWCLATKPKAKRKQRKADRKVASK